MRPSRRQLRVFHGLVILLLCIPLATGYVSSLDAEFNRFEDEAQRPPSERAQLAEPRDNVTVVTTSPRRLTKAELVAFGSDGRVLYYNNTYFKYFDVDPLHGRTVVYAAHAKEEDCFPDGSVCDKLVFESVNLTTGETDRLYESVQASHAHDADLEGSKLLVANINHNEVYETDIDTGVGTFTWKADSQYSVGSGGVYPSDWTHLNDVERVREDTVMVSVRNQDQVVFVDRQRGLLENWTLGADGEHSVLYEQHNPDYIPAENGGPAVVVSDSENNRLVEYRRTDGDWVRSWQWQDSTLQWPRDADRLPNGHTLVTDSNGNRVIEINESGGVVWSVQVDTPYEAERLGTGAESTGGPAAHAANLTGTGVASENGTAQEGPSLLSWQGFKDVMPSLVVNTMTFVAPPWASAWHIIDLWLLVATVLSFLATELYFSPLSVRSPITRTR